MNTESNNINISELLGRPLWQLTCQEYVALMRHLLSESGNAGNGSTPPRQAIGMTALAKALGCSTSLLYGIRHNVDFGAGVVSKIGRKEVYDIETIRSIANDYMKREREARLRRTYDTGA